MGELIRRTEADEAIFYAACAEALGLPDPYRRYPYSKRTRWNNRVAGNGRFEGAGIIRMFGANAIQVALHTPRLHGIFTSAEAALEAIRAVASLSREC